MLNALAEVGERLHRQNLEGKIYVVGGAAVVLAYHGNRMTRDIDALVAPEAEVFAISRQVGADLNLPEDWLNDTVRGFMPENLDPDDGPLVLDVPGLAVRAAPADVILAMKLLAAREKDLDDIRLLADELGFSSRQAIWKVVSTYHPQAHLLDKTTHLIDAMFEAEITHG